MTKIPPCRALFPLLFWVTACNPAAPTDNKRTAELADKLVACQNERSNTKEELGQAKADLARAQSQLAALQEKIAAPPPRAGRTPPRMEAFTHEVPGAHPSVRGRRPEPTGPADPAAEAQEAQAVAQLLRARAAQLRVCYERGLKHNDKLQFVTQVKVQLTVDPSGAARDVVLHPRTEPEMEGCIRQTITRWQFPPFRGHAVTVEQPVNLKVQGS